MMNKQAFISGFNYALRKYAEEIATVQQAPVQKDAIKTQPIKEGPMSESEFAKYYAARYPGIGLTGVNNGTFAQDAKDAFARYLRDYYAQKGMSYGTNTVSNIESYKAPPASFWFNLARLTEPEQPERQPKPQEIASTR